MQVKSSRYIPIGRLGSWARTEAFRLAERLDSYDQPLPETERQSTHNRLVELAEATEYQPATTWRDLNVVPVILTKLNVKPLVQAERGVDLAGNELRYSVTSDGVEILRWAEYPARLLSQMDYRSTLAETVSRVKEAALSGPERAQINEIERESGETFDSYLTDVAFYFAIKLGATGTVYFKRHKANHA